MKRCPRCSSQGREALRPLNEFGVCRNHSDGLNIYCRTCCREKVKLQRDKRRAYVELAPKRKVCRPSQPIWRLRISDREKVKVAYARGITDRTEIRRATRLYMHDVSEVIAELYDAGEIKWNPKRQSFQLAA